jgi:hypothetical protein
MRDDIEIYQMMQLNNGYRMDSQKLNRILLDRMKNPPMLIDDHNGGAGSKTTETQSLNIAKTPTVNIEVNMEEKEVIYQKHELKFYGT